MPERKVLKYRERILAMNNFQFIDPIKLIASINARMADCLYLGDSEETWKIVPSLSGRRGSVMLRRRLQLSSDEEESGEGEQGRILSHLTSEKDAGYVILNRQHLDDSDEPEITESLLLRVKRPLHTSHGTIHPSSTHISVGGDYYGGSFEVERRDHRKYRVWPVTLSRRADLSRELPTTWFLSEIAAARYAAQVRRSA